MYFASTSDTVVYPESMHKRKKDSSPSRQEKRGEGVAQGAK
jgi:hypothetical protein